jgi:NAD(P)-dependent dehydrogenase (short-subunit alcohol dehydrogenase family)
MEVRNKVAIVTGAGGGGSGRAEARRLAREGARVVVSDIDEAGGHETARLISADGGTATFVRADVAIETDVRSLIAAAERTYGGLDILVNNAGPYYQKEPLEYWKETVEGNLLGTMYGIIHAVEAMRRRHGGAIITIGSTSAVGHGWKHSLSPAYDAAKAGVMRLTTTLAWLKDKDNIRVNCLVPDWVATEEIARWVEPLTPQQRKAERVPDVLTTLDEIGDAMMQLIRDDTLAGRILVWWSGEPRRLIPVGDRGHGLLD